MKKTALFVLVLIFTLLIVSCKQDINNLKLNIPNWLQGRYSLLGTMNIKGADPQSLTGNLTFSSNNITGSITVSDVTSSINVEKEIEEKKDYITGFSQLSSSNDFTYTITTEMDGVTHKYTIQINNNGLTKTYTETESIDGTRYGTIEATLSPM